MTASENTPQKGQECSGVESNDQPNWEQLAKRELYISLKEEATDGVVRAANNISRTVEESENGAEALEEYRLKMLAFEERSREVMYDLNELDRSSSSERILTGALAFAHVVCMSGSDRELEADYLRRLIELAEERYGEDWLAPDRE